MARTGYYEWRGADLLLFCHSQPQASRDEFAGAVASDRHGERLKIRIMAPAVDGKANIRLIAFLARQFGVAKQAVRITAGDSARQKTVLIERPTVLPEILAITPSIAPFPTTL